MFTVLFDCPCVPAPGLDLILANTPASPVKMGQTNLRLEQTVLGQWPPVFVRNNVVRFLISVMLRRGAFTLLPGSNLPPLAQPVLNTGTALGGFPPTHPSLSLQDWQFNSLVGLGILERFSINYELWLKLLI